MDHRSRSQEGYDPRSIELMNDTRAKATGIRRRLWDAWVDSCKIYDGAGVEFIR